MTVNKSGKRSENNFSISLGICVSMYVKEFEEALAFLSVFSRVYELNRDYYCVARLPMDEDYSWIPATGA